MPWLKEDDCADEHPALMGMARTQREADLILGIHIALKLYCAKHLTDGFVPELKVRRHLRGRLLDRFLEAGVLHTREDDCECLEGRTWPPEMTYAVHAYLASNPTRDEYDVARAKAAELKDHDLLAAVRRRDRDLCRYCRHLTKGHDRRSANGLVFDHVDPAVANGAANLVVACRSCNSRKNKRTPEAAGMNLLPEPSDPGWSVPHPQPPLHSPSAGASDEVPGASDGDQAPTSRPTNGTTYTPTSEVTNRSTNWSITGPTTSRAGTGRDGTGRAKAGSAGPDGERDQVGPAPPRKSSTHPDPYRRKEITGPHPADHAGLPRGPPAP